MMNDDLIANNHEEKVICQACKKVINEPAFVVVNGVIIKNSGNPKVFTCPEQMANYNAKIILHDACWIEMLRSYGTKLYDMDEVIKKYNEEAKKKKEENK